MKDVGIIRSPTGDAGTFGAIMMPWANWQRPSLELPWRQNIRRRSCILPAPGDEVTYIATLRETTKWSPRPDGRLYGLLNVQGRTDIIIHAGTWAGDEDLEWKSDLLGCIAPGSRTGLLRPEGYTREQPCLLGSRAALTEFMALTEGDDLRIRIRWDAGATDQA